MWSLPLANSSFSVVIFWPPLGTWSSQTGDQRLGCNPSCSCGPSPRVGLGIESATHRATAGAPSLSSLDGAEVATIRSRTLPGAASRPGQEAGPPPTEYLHSSDITEKPGPSAGPGRVSGWEFSLSSHCSAALSQGLCPQGRWPRCSALEASPPNSRQCRTVRDPFTPSSVHSWTQAGQAISTADAI